MDEVEKLSQLSEDPVGNAPTPRPLLKPKILSVDDDATNQELIKRTLGSRYDVDVAMDGYEALNYLKSCNRAPDVMLLDVMMPGLSGFDVCRAVRQEMHIPPVRLPILMLSASAEAESIAAGLDSGANDYITKPFHKQILTAHVEAALRLSHWHKQELDQAAGRPMRRVRMFRSEADSENGVRRRVVPNHCD
jgi:DNA-binding response OmpR family regulator